MPGSITPFGLGPGTVMNRFSNWNMGLNMGRGGSGGLGGGAMGGGYGGYGGGGGGGGGAMGGGGGYGHRVAEFGGFPSQQGRPQGGIPFNDAIRPGIGMPWR